MSPWFKVDDGLSSKAQTTRIPRANRRAALGVWALAGSWSAKELTDGHIPEHMLEELTGTPEDAAWLVAAEYWAVVDDGWQFVEWEPDQPLREAVLASRKKNAEKVSTWRSRNRTSNPVTPSVTNPVSDAPVTLPPSRPGPSRPGPDQEELKDPVQPPATPPSAVQSEFDEWWEDCWRKQAKPDAFKAFKAARKDTSMAVLVAGAQTYKLLNIGQDKSKLKMPAGWLRDRRWEDEPVVHTPSSTTGQAGADCPRHPGQPKGDWMNPCRQCERDRPSKADQIDDVRALGRRMQEDHDRGSKDQQILDVIETGQRMQAEYDMKELNAF